MKKFIITIMIIFFLTGCGNVGDNSITNTTVDDEQEIENQEEIKDEYVDDNPIKLGLYMYTNSSTNRKLLTEYSPVWKNLTDLCSLEVYYTNDSELELMSQKDLWNFYYNQYSDIESYKIGFEIEFDTTDGHIRENILTPDDTTKGQVSFIQTYLYDDIKNSGKGFYSHLTKEDFDENTIISSIKITAGTYSENVTSDVKLTVFTYNDDKDFDENGFYRGNSKYTITIKKS